MEIWYCMKETWSSSTHRPSLQTLTILRYDFPFQSCCFVIFLLRAARKGNEKENNYGCHYHNVCGRTCRKFLFPVKWKHINELLQTVCTLLLIFSMGVLLGSRENFLASSPRWDLRAFCFS